nr:hypothetical protein [Corynebacterium lactis]
MTRKFRATLAQSARSHPERVGWVFVLAWIFALTTAICWPLFTPASSATGSTIGRFGPPQFLLRDMVIPPHPPLTDATLGLGSSAARAVPQDTLLWALGYFVDASHWVRFLMVGACVVGGLAAAELARTMLSGGAGRARSVSLVGQVVAPTMLLWNPFVVERLLQGQWSLVIAALLLPAVVVAVRMRNPWWRTSAIALAGLTPTGAVLAGITGLVAARSWRDRTWVALTTAAVSAPWLVASALNFGAAATADPAGAGAFAARAEAHVGTLGALLGLGGIWNRQAVPLTREVGFSAAMVLVLLALFALGFRRVWGSEGGWRPARGLVVLAGAAIGLVALAATGPGIAAMGWVLEHVPGAGLLRDGQKWVALALPGYVLLAAAGAEHLATRARVVSVAGRGESTPTARARGRAAQWLAGAVSCLIVIAAVPTLPADVSQLRPVPSWAGWSSVSGVVAMDEHAVAVLPAGSYRIIDGLPVYDPAFKTLPAPVVGSGELIVSGTAISGEGSSEVERTLLAGVAGVGEAGAPGAPGEAEVAGVGGTAEAEAALEVLRRNGVGWVLVENSPGNMGNSASLLEVLDPVYGDRDLQIYHVPGIIQRPAGPGQVDYALAWLAFGLWVAACWQGPWGRRCRGGARC